LFFEEDIVQPTVKHPASVKMPQRRLTKDDLAILKRIPRQERKLQNSA
jgi:hypothetical protein